MQLSGKRCAVYSSDLRVRVTATGLATYPDVTVVCGKLEVDPEDAHSVTNPSVIIEVSSPSTASYDRETKYPPFRRASSQRMNFSARAPVQFGDGVPDARDVACTG